MEKKNYYFTFGANHLTKKGEKIHNQWVRVISTDPKTARMLFREHFMEVYMHNWDHYAFQYDDDNFDPEYFPGGELKLINV